MVDIEAIKKAGARGALVKEYENRLRIIKTVSDNQYMPNADAALQSIEANLADAKALAAAWKEICHG